EMAALRRSIAQVKEYQVKILPQPPAPVAREGVELGLRFTPLESAGLYFPGGKASYPSSLIMLAVPAQVAGVKRISVVTPPSKYGRSDLVLAACHELKLTDVFRAGGAAAIAAPAVGTKTIPSVDQIVRPGQPLRRRAREPADARRRRCPEKAHPRRRRLRRPVLPGSRRRLRRWPEPLPADEHHGAVQQRHQRVRVPEAIERGALRARRIEE